MKLEASKSSMSIKPDIGDVENFLRSEEGDTAEVLSLVAKVVLEEWDLTTQDGCDGLMKELCLVWSSLSDDAIKMMNTFSLINASAFEAIDSGETCQ